MTEESFPCTNARFSGSAGPFSACSVIKFRMNVSVTPMCSAHSAIDQRSGAGLKFHCASESPFGGIQEGFARAFQLRDALFALFLRQGLPHSWNQQQQCECHRNDLHDFILSVLISRSLFPLRFPTLRRFHVQIQNRRPPTRCTDLFLHLRPSLTVLFQPPVLEFNPRRLWPLG